MVPHSWILECARMAGVAQNIITLYIEQYGKLGDSVDFKPGGTWESTYIIHQRRLIITTDCDHHDTTVNQSPTLYGWLEAIWKE